jgi:hypothetical protein
MQGRIASLAALLALVLDGALEHVTDESFDVHERP